MHRVGLTGGIASGKSQVARILAALGATVVDHDILARKAVEPGSAGLQKIAAQFGTHVLTPEGELDRKALGAVVFSDPEALAALNAIVHPEVKKLAAQADDEHRGRTDVIVHDIPLLTEISAASEFDAVIVVEAPEQQRIDRMVTNRAMSVQDARARIAAQATDAERKVIATHIICNDSSLDQLRTEVEKVWQQILRSNASDVVRKD